MAEFTHKGEGEWVRHVRGVMRGHQVGARAGDKAGGGRASDGTKWGDN